MLITGKNVSEKILKETQEKIQECNVRPGLGVILIGDDAPSHLYVNLKETQAQRIGIHFEKKIFSSSVTQEEVEAEVRRMNADENLHGIIIQLPLPEHLNTESLIASIDPEKDTDGFHPETIQKFLNGDETRLPVFPRAMMELVRMNQEKKVGEQALAVVNSELMGKVLAHALEISGYQALVVQGSEQEKIQSLLPEQSIVLTALGKPGVVSTFVAKPGSIFVDGGISYDQEGKVIGDIARDDGVYRDDVLVTAVPGGVGPVTVAVLLARVTETAIRNTNKKSA